MNLRLAKFGNLPVSSATLALEYPEIRKHGQKLSLLARDGDIIRLKRGLYVCTEKATGKILSMELIANRLLTPSYVSMSSALRYYGLIPEAVYLTQSMTTGEYRWYDTPVGSFAYSHIKKEAFSTGVRNITENGYSFLIASPEKALCDLIAETPSLLLRYRKEAIEYLESDIRLDMDAFCRFNPEILEHYIAAGGKKATTVATILKLLNEYAKRDI